MKKKSTKETPTELSEAYVINAYKDGIEEDEDTDVHVRFDGYRIGLSFNDGNGYSSSLTSCSPPSTSWQLRGVGSARCRGTGEAIESCPEGA